MRSFLLSAAVFVSSTLAASLLPSIHIGPCPAFPTYKKYNFGGPKSSLTNGNYSLFAYNYDLDFMFQVAELTPLVEDLSCWDLEVINTNGGVKLDYGVKG